MWINSIFHTKYTVVFTKVMLISISLNKINFLKHKNSCYELLLFQINFVKTTPPNLPSPPHLSSARHTKPTLPTKYRE
jgi:hypothetical protein